MRVPVTIVNAFKEEYQPKAEEFLRIAQYLAPEESLEARRYLTRSIVPHIQALSNLFNRKDGEQTDAIDTETYWKDSNNPKNRRLSYFLGFSASNSFRVASVWGELHRLGFKFQPKNEEFKLLELGAGLGAGAAGAIFAETSAPLGIGNLKSVSLVEQNKAALEFGAAWIQHLDPSWTVKPFHRKVNLAEEWLPKTSPVFDAIITSYFLNESGVPANQLAKTLTEFARKHLDENGVMILVEPALKLQSRRLLELRKELIALKELKVLTPCLGEQACGALKNPEDWCHEIVTWWRPKFLAELDQITGLDHKFLPFSYLVLSKKGFIPRISPTHEEYRLVSPVRKIGRDEEFYVCGIPGKFKALSRTAQAKLGTERGDILSKPKIANAENEALFAENKVLRFESFELLK